MTLQVCSASILYLLVSSMQLDESVEISSWFFISAVPSVAPKKVWARSVSATQIEFNWEAVPATPERVLGYEVRVIYLIDKIADTVQCQIMVLLCSLVIHV